MTMERQQQFAWERGSQLACLREAVVPWGTTHDGSRCSPAALKSVLRVIDDHGGGREAWLGYETIAREAGISTRTAKRCVEVLVASSLLIVATRRSAAGVVCNHYRIVWNELDLLRPSRIQRVAPLTAPVPSPAAKPELSRDTSFASVEACTVPSGNENRPPGRSATHSERSAMVTERSAMVTPAECHHGTQSAPRSAFEAPPPPTPAFASEWAAAAAKFRGRIGQIDSLAAIAQSRGESPTEWQQNVEFALRVAQANAARLSKPMGAVVYYLRTGTWPVDVVSPEQRAMVDQKRTEATRRQLTEQAVFELVKTARRQGADDDTVLKELRAKFSPELLAEMGWK